ncbi:MAG: TolC family protein, partial [Microcystis sp. M020S1]|nr:TolC family protein [Microcystis sp. M020S1]
EPSVEGMTPEELTTFLGNLGLLQPVEEFLTQNPNATPEQVQQFLSTRLAQNYQAFLEKNGFREYVLQRYGSNPTDEQLIQAETDFLNEKVTSSASDGDRDPGADAAAFQARVMYYKRAGHTTAEAIAKALEDERSIAGGGSGGGGGGGKKKTGGSGSNGDGGGDSSGGDGFLGRVNRLYNNPKIQAIGNILITGSVLVGIGSVAAQWFAASPDIDSSSIDPFKIPLDTNGKPDFDSIKFLTPEQILQAGGNKADLNAPSKNGYIDLRALPKEFFYNVDNVKKLRHAINVHFSNQMLAAEVEMLASTGVNLDASALTVLSRQFTALFNRKEFLGSTNDMNHPSYWGRTQPMGVAATQVTNYANQVMRQLDELVAQNRADLWNGTVTGFPADLSILEDKFQFDGINPTEQLINRANNTNVAAHELLEKLTPDNAVILASTTTQEINKLSSDIGVALSTLGTTIKQIEEKNNKLKKYQKELQAEAEQLRKWSGVEPNQITQKLTQIESIYNTNNNAIATIRSQISSLQLQMNGLTNTLTQISLQTAQYAKQVQAYELQQEQLITSQRAVEKQEEAIRTARNNQNQADQNAAYQALGQAITAYNIDVSQDRRPGTPIPTFVFGGYTVHIPPAPNTSNKTLSWDNLVNGLYSRLFANPDAITYLNKRGAGLPEGEAERKKYIEKLLKESLGEAAARYEGSPVVSPGSSPIDPDRPENRQPDPTNPDTPNTPYTNPVRPEGEQVPYFTPTGGNPEDGSNPEEPGTLVANNKLFFLEPNESVVRERTTSSGGIASNPEDNVLSIGEMFARANERNIELKRARQEILQDKELMDLLNDPDFRIALGANFSGNQLLGGQSLSPLLNALTISVPLYNAKNRGAKANAAAKLQLSIAALVNQETQVKKQIIETRLKYYQTLSDLEKQQKLVDSLNRQIVDTRTLEDVGAISPGS